MTDKQLAKFCSTMACVFDDLAESMRSKPGDSVSDAEYAVKAMAWGLADGFRNAVIDLADEQATVESSVPPVTAEDPTA